MIITTYRFFPHLPACQPTKYENSASGLWKARRREARTTVGSRW